MPLVGLTVPPAVGLALTVSVWVGRISKLAVTVALAVPMVKVVGLAVVLETELPAPDTVQLLNL